MKRTILLTLLLAATAWGAMAQRPRTRVEWGVIGGINVPDYTTNMKATEIRNKCGWQAGVSVCGTGTYIQYLQAFLVSVLLDTSLLLIFTPSCEPSFSSYLVIFHFCVP